MRFDRAHVDLVCLHLGRAQNVRGKIATINAREIKLGVSLWYADRWFMYIMRDPIRSLIGACGRSGVLIVPCR